MTKISLILADDHAVVRSGLRMLLEAQPDMEIVAEAESGAQAVALVAEHRPAVILMDIQMPELNGIDATREIRRLSTGTAVLALTMHEDEQYFFEMLQAGASGYVPKRAAPDELVAAIRTVARGDVFLYPSLATRLVKDYLRRAEVDGEPVDYDILTPREREVLTLIAEGLSNADIADRLVISVKTVDRHRENLMRKLNMHSRVELVKYALRTGLIELAE
jgi:two-component system response regulator NreC